MAWSGVWMCVGEMCVVGCGEPATGVFGDMTLLGPQKLSEATLCATPTAIFSKRRKIGTPTRRSTSHTCIIGKCQWHASVSWKVCKDAIMGTPLETSTYLQCSRNSRAAASQTSECCAAKIAVFNTDSMQPQRTAAQCRGTPGATGVLRRNSSASSSPASSGSSGGSSALRAIWQHSFHRHQSFEANTASSSSSAGSPGVWICLASLTPSKTRLLARATARAFWQSLPSP